MRIVYVESCTECGCALVRSEDGEQQPSARLVASCGGCRCHTTLPKAAGA